MNVSLMNTSKASTPIMEKQFGKGVKIAGMPPVVFLIVAVITLTGLYLEVLPNNMVSGFALTMVIGGFLHWIGEKIPVFNMFGGSAILCVITPALLVYWGLFPESGVEIISNFFSGYGFVDFLIAALITGSLLGMDRRILIKVGARFFVPVIGGVVCTFLIGGAIGSITGFGFSEAILFIVAPIMGGGIGAGAIPMAEVYATTSGQTSDNFLSLIVPSVVFGNFICILIAGILHGIAKRKGQMFIGFNGNGEMLRVKSDFVIEEQKENKSNLASFDSLAVGLMIAGTLYMFGYLVNLLVPQIHTYAWTIIAAACIKIFNLAPASVEKATVNWCTFATRAWIPTILVAVSTSLVNIDQMIEVITNPAYLVISVITVVVSSLAAGFFGWLVSMYFVESSIAAGLCMADMGGSGDVAVLGTSERMQLMPFAQVSSRLGGALVILIISFLTPLLL